METEEKKGHAIIIAMDKAVDKGMGQEDEPTGEESELYCPNCGARLEVEIKKAE